MKKPSVQPIGWTSQLITIPILFYSYYLIEKAQRFARMIRIHLSIPYFYFLFMPIRVIR